MATLDLLIKVTMMNACKLQDKKKHREFQISSRKWDWDWDWEQ